MNAQAVTVVIPVHNGASTLARVIEPLKSELLQGDAILAVDDRSTDGSPDLLRELGVEVLTADGRPGAAGTRNKGGFAAATPWILFVDSDAVAPRGWRRKLAERMSDARAVQGVYHSKAPGNGAATFYKNYYYFHTFTRRIRSPYIKGCGTFFFAVRTEDFRRLGGFDENISGATIEDADFSERLWASGGRTILAPEIRVYHLREYTAGDFFRYEWNMMRAKALYLLRRDRDRGAPSVSVAGVGEMLPVLAGALFAWILITGAALSLAGIFPGIHLLLGGLAGLVICQIPFIYHCIRDGGFRGVRACLYLLPDLALVVPSVLFSMGSYAAGRKYL